MNTWSHKYVAAKLHKSPRDYRRSDRDTRKPRIKVIVGLSMIAGNHAPYFSVTGEVYFLGRNDFESGGCIHEEILAHFPKLAPVIALHLSDIDGVPMHAEANGWYWLRGMQTGLMSEPYPPDKSPEECTRIFANHCRISEQEANEIALSLKVAAQENRRKLWTQICDSMRPRWKTEAEAGIALLDTMIEHQAERRATRAATTPTRN